MQFCQAEQRITCPPRPPVSFGDITTCEIPCTSRVASRVASRGRALHIANTVVMRPQLVATHRKAQHRRAVYARWHSRTPFTTSSHKGGARCIACAHILQVSTRSCSWPRSKCSSVANAHGDVKSTWNPCEHGEPQFVPTYCRNGFWNPCDQLVL